MRNLVLFFLLVFSLFSCEKELDMDIPANEPKIVVNSFINPDSTFRLHLSESSHVLSNDVLPAIIGGTVELYEELTLIETLADLGNGYYSSNKKPQSGKKYSIKVTKSGFKTITSSDAVPFPVTMSGLDTGVAMEHGTEMREVKLTIDDPAESNYYNLRLYSFTEEYRYNSSTNLIDTLNKFSELYFSSEDVIFQESHGTLGAVFTDELFNGKKYSLKVKVSSAQYGSYTKGKKIHVVLNNLSKEHFLYLQSLQKYNFSNDPFSQPVRVYSNILNGFGIFGAFTSYRDSI